MASDDDITPDMMADELCGRIMIVIHDLVPIARGRTYSKAIDKLEEAIFWIQKGKRQSRMMPP
jgi:hypothetical protein